jgi:hypothetical protein
MSTENTNAPKTSLLSKILDNALDAIKRPFVVKRVERAFSSAADSLEEQILGIQAEQTEARENLVKAAKSEGNLGSYIQTLISLQSKLTSLQTAQKSLETEKNELFG